MPNAQIELYHHGIKGQKWGDRNGPPYPLGASDYSKRERDFKYAKISNKKVKIDKYGNRIFPKNFYFNRVGQNRMDINKSGALYVSYGKQDAARYVKNLGPTLIGKLLNQYGTTIQHIKTKSEIKMPSNEKVAIEIANLLNKNEKLRSALNETMYSMVLDDGKITKNEINKALKKPSTKDGQKLAYSVIASLGAENMNKEASIVYDHFRNLGYDALPDLNDIYSGTSNTAMIIINPKKITIESKTTISKDVMKEARTFVKSIEKIPISDLIK